MSNFSKLKKWMCPDARLWGWEMGKSGNFATLFGDKGAGEGEEKWRAACVGTHPCQWIYTAYRQHITVSGMSGRYKC
ncbi:MAG: hypothetical protein KME26_19440 [Oscillatoria princeps RMCB-10]|nr:hypothetical protein [Oscillatoria princeps RMCB-10]